MTASLSSTRFTPAADHAACSASLRSLSERTVPVSISLITGATAYEVPWGSIMAASVIVTVPLVLLVLIFQKKIVSGLTAGAVKG